MDLSNNSSSPLSEELVRWIQLTTGGELIRVKRLPGGNRREAIALDVMVDGKREELFLRFDPVDPSTTGDLYTIQREAKFYGALQNTTVLIPQVIAVHPTLEALLTRRVTGRSSYSKIKDAGEKNTIALDFMRQLARLHNIDRDLVAARFPEAVKSIPALIEAEIQIWAEMYERVEPRDPLIEFGLGWLRQHIPQVNDAPTIVHGDAGPGNFLFDDGGVTALLDWELAHIGDPIEDLGWLSMRTVLEPFPDFTAAVRQYELERGGRVEPVRLLFHRVLVEWKIAIIRHRSAGEDAANSLISRSLNRRLLVEAIAAASGESLPTYKRMHGTGDEGERVSAAALEYLRDIVAPAISDPLAAAKVKSVARVIKYMQQLLKFQATAEHAEISEMTRLTGRTPQSVEEGKADLSERIRRGEFVTSMLLPYFTQLVGRETQLMESSLGTLAWRPFPAYGNQGLPLA